MISKEVWDLNTRQNRSDFQGFADLPMNLALQKLKSQKNSPMRGVLLNQMNPQKAADIESPAFVSLLFILTTWDTRLMSCRK